MKQTNALTFTDRGVPCGIPTGIDWAKADYNSDEGRKALATAMSAYLRDLREGSKKAVLEARKAALIEQLKTTRPGHIPGGLPDIPDIDVNFYTQQDDFGVFELFRYVDKSSSKNPVYQFAHVSAGAIAFEQRREGQPVRIGKVSGGTPGSVSSVGWHGAIGIDDDARRFDDYGIFEQNLQAVPSKWRNKQADALVALITALGAGVNETWSTDLITTVNNGCAQILEDCADIYGVGDNPEFVLFYNHRRAPDVRKALVSELTLANDNNSAKQLEFRIRPVKTRKITSASLYLALPGYDMVEVEWDALYAEYGRDWARGADAHVYRSRWNAAIGNTQQVRRITPA